MSDTQGPGPQQPNTPFLGWPGSYLPDLATQAMPEIVFDAQVQQMGIRFGWLRSHSCPCVNAIGGKWGTPNPNCLTCGGRGVYWDPPLSLSAHLTYMHTTAAPDEPGAMTSETLGHLMEGMPVLTVPFGGPENEQTVWQLGSSFDAFVEYDAITRLDTVLVSGRQEVLPYQWGVKILQVASYATGTNSTAPVASTNYTLSNGSVILNSAVYPLGTAYTVDYTASPVLIAFRSSGGIPHARPFAQGRTRIPRRFHLQVADAWLRDRFGGELPGSGKVPICPWR